MQNNGSNNGQMRVLVSISDVGDDDGKHQKALTKALVLTSRKSCTFCQIYW